MKKLILIIILLIVSVTIINLCSDDSTKIKKKKYIETLADGTVCEFFNVSYEMEFVATSRILKPEEYNVVADLFHFPKTKMVYFHLDSLREIGEQYGTLYELLALPVKKFNPDSLLLIRAAKQK